MTAQDLTIVAVHGNGGGSTRFDRMSTHIGPGVRFVAIDLPGFNGAPVDPTLTNVAGFADRLAELVDDARSGGSPAVVLGHGIGGSISLDLASRRPDALDALILHAPVGADLDTRLFPRIMSTRPMRALIKRAISARLPRPLWRRLFFPTGAPKHDIDTFFEGYRDCASFGQMFDIIDFDWFDALEPVTELPVTLLWGEHDRVLKAGQTDAIAAKAPQANRVIQPGWDHFPMLEQPEEYARVIEALARELAS